MGIEFRLQFLNFSDYRHIPELDRYDAADLVEEDEGEEMDYQTRLAAEQEMEKRDRIYGARRWNRVDDDDGIRVDQNDSVMCR